MTIKEILEQISPKALKNAAIKGEFEIILEFGQLKEILNTIDEALRVRVQQIGRKEYRAWSEFPRRLEAYGHEFIVLAHKLADAPKMPTEDAVKKSVVRPL